MSVIGRKRARPMFSFAANHVGVSAVDAVLRSAPTRTCGRSTSVGPSRVDARTVTGLLHEQLGGQSFKSTG